MVGGLIGERTVDEEVHIKVTVYGLEKWTPLVIFVGVGMLVAGVLVVAQYVNEKVEVKSRRRGRLERRQWPSDHQEIGIAV